MKNQNESLLLRFIEYVKIDTQANPESTSSPSTQKQKILSKLLFQQCKDMGLEDVIMTEQGYVYATLPSTTNKNVPTLCFCSHMDTAPDSSGTNVQPIVHRNYNGEPIILPKDNEQVISTKNHPILKNHIGEDIITSSGDTLLGADDKSGLAIILQTSQYLLENPDIKHGKIRLLFTTDEEIGRGVDHVNMDLLNADFGYTLDGGQTGSFEDETFSADAVTITINGVSAHPGYAKGSMEHSIKIASEILTNLPQETLTPESTEGRQGFIHPIKISGELEQTTIHFIIRDFDTLKLKEYEDLLEKIVVSCLEKYPNSSYKMNITEQYRNMNEVLVKHPQVTQYAQEALQRAGMKMIRQPIRGGTDGSRLSFMGMPCANIFTGMHGIHSKQEWISLQDMVRSMETLLHLSQVWEENA